MGFKEVLSKIREKNRERKELMKRADDELRVHKALEERQKSANERELERYLNEDREKLIKENLEVMRKKRDHDIRFNHNPLDVQNITNKNQWEVLKERNMFSGNKNVITNQPFIHKSNGQMFHNNKKLLSGRGMFSI